MLQLFLSSLLWPFLALLSFGVLWRSPLAARWQRFRIGTAFVPAGQIRFELILNFLYPFVTAVGVMGLFLLMDRLHLVKIYYRAEQYGMNYLIFSSLGFVILADFFRYWIHRALHHPLLYRHIHSWHHSSVNSNPLSAFSMHPLDLLSGVPWLVAANFFPVYFTTILIFANFYQIQNLYRHFGFDVFSARNVFVTARFHDIHHRDGSFNYGASLTCWDYLFGTITTEIPA